MKTHTIAESQSNKFSEATENFCPVQLTIHIFSGKWKLLILWNLRSETKRFGELGRAIPTITQAMLSQHLKELEEDGIVTRKMYMEVPPKVEYSLSPVGQTLIPLIAAMEKWGISYAKDFKKLPEGNCLWSEEE